jgi:hypothetical protein
MMRRVIYFLRELAWTAIIAVVVGAVVIIVALLSRNPANIVVALGANAILYSVLALRS